LESISSIGGLLHVLGLAVIALSLCLAFGQLCRDVEMERNVKAQGFENFREHRRGELSLMVHKVYRGWSVTAKSSLNWSFLCTLSTDPPGQLDVLGHDGDTLGVDGAQVGVLEQPNQVGLAGLLQGTDGSGLEPQVSLEVLSNLPDQPLEGQLADQQLSGLLVTPDLTESDCAGPVPMGLLHSSCGRS